MAEAQRPVVLYLGGFELPDRNAAAHRVLANGKLLRDLGYEVVFLGVSRDLPAGSPINPCEADGFRCFAQPYPQDVAARLRSLLSARQAVRVLDRLPETRIVIAYNYPAAALLSLACACRRRDVRIVADCTEWYGDARPLKALDTWARMRLIQPHLDGVLCISRLLERYYDGRAIPTLRLPPLIDRGDSIWDADPLVDETPAVPRRLRLVYAGDAGRSKDRLDRAVRLVGRLGGKATLTVIGMTRERYLALQAKDRKDEPGPDVRFLGRRSREECLRRIRGADFTIFLRDASRVVNAGFPTKHVESVTCGTPVLTSRTSDLPAYLREGMDGVFLDEADDAAASQIERIADLYAAAPPGGVPASPGIPTRATVDRDRFHYGSRIPALAAFLRRIGAPPPVDAPEEPPASASTVQRISAAAAPVRPRLGASEAWLDWAAGCALAFCTVSSIYPPLRAFPSAAVASLAALGIWVLLSLVRRPASFLRMPNRLLLPALVLAYCVAFSYATGHGTIGNRYLSLWPLFVGALLYEHHRREGRMHILRAVIGTTLLFASFTMIRTAAALLLDPYASRRIKSGGEISYSMMQQGIGDYAFIYCLVLLAVLLLGLAAKTRSRFVRGASLAGFAAASVVILLSNYLTAVLIVLLASLSLWIVATIRSPRRRILSLSLMATAAALFVLVNLEFEGLVSLLSTVLPNGKIARLLASFDGSLLKGLIREFTADRWPRLENSSWTAFFHPLRGILERTDFTTARLLEDVGQHSFLLDTLALFGYPIGLLALSAPAAPFAPDRFRGSSVLISAPFVLASALLLALNNATPSIGFALSLFYPFLADLKIQGDP